jgi:Immunity protein Imm1
MTLEFLDLQDTSNPLNASRIESAKELVEALDHLRARDAFVFELEGDKGFKLTIGLGGGVSFVQHSLSNGDPPYLLAVAPDEKKTGAENRPRQTGDDLEDVVEFLCGDTPTPVPIRYYLPYEVMREIAICFLATGSRSEAVSWEEIGASG